MNYLPHRRRIGPLTMDWWRWDGPSGERDFVLRIRFTRRAPDSADHEEATAHKGER